MYITMGTAVYGYISYEFLGLFEAPLLVYCFSTCFRTGKTRNYQRSHRIQYRQFGRVDPEMGHTGILTDHA